MLIFKLSAAAFEAKKSQLHKYLQELSIDLWEKLTTILIS